MFDALLVWWRAFRHYNHYGYRYIWTNIAWVLLSLPIVTAPAAWAGFVYVSHKLYQGEVAGLNEFWAAFKANLLRGAVMAVANLAIVGINIFNLISYSQSEDVTVMIMRAVWIIALALWFIVQIYLYPILLEMETPNLRGGLRNAVVMAYLNPIFSVTLLLLYLLLFALGYIVVVLWMLVIGGVMAAVATGAVLDRLARAGLRPPVADPTGMPEINDVDIT